MNQHVAVTTLAAHPVEVPPAVAAAAALRAERIPPQAAVRAAWFGLPGKVQAQIGAAAISLGFYSWLSADVAYTPGVKWLPADAVYEASANADRALAHLLNLTEHTVPALFGNDMTEPAWARADGEGVSAPAALSPVVHAIAHHRQAWDGLQAASAFLDATGRADRKAFMWPASDAECEALCDLLEVPCANRDDAAALLAHLRWYLTVASTHPKRGVAPGKNLAAVSARMADLRLILGDAAPVPPAPILEAVEANRTAWLALKAASAAGETGTDRWHDLQGTAQGTLDALTEVSCGNRKGAKALMAHALWYAAELAAADEDTVEWLEGDAKRLAARCGDLAVWLPVRHAAELAVALQVGAAAEREFKTAAVPAGAAPSPLLAAIELHRLAFEELAAAGPFDGEDPKLVALDNAEMDAMEALLAAPYSTRADAIALVSHLRPFVGEKKHPVLKDMGEVTCDVLAKVLDVCSAALAAGDGSAAACRE